MLDGRRVADLAGDGRPRRRLGGREPRGVGVGRDREDRLRVGGELRGVGNGHHRKRALQHRACVLPGGRRHPGLGAAGVGHRREALAAQDVDALAVTTELDGRRVPAGRDESLHDARAGPADVDHRDGVVVGAGHEQGLAVG